MGKLSRHDLMCLPFTIRCSCEHLESLRERVGIWIRVSSEDQSKAENPEHPRRRFSWVRSIRFSTTFRCWHVSRSGIPLEDRLKSHARRTGNRHSRGSGCTSTLSSFAVRKHIPITVGAILVAATFLFLSLSLSSQGGDWTGWQGPDRNGWVEDFEPPQSWAERLPVVGKLKSELATARRSLSAMHFLNG